jgi:hypothetical protein
MKTPIKIRNWFFVGNRLCGDVDNHPDLGNCNGGVITTSKIVRVETQNNIYELEGHPHLKMWSSTRMAVREDK